MWDEDYFVWMGVCECGGGTCEGKGSEGCTLFLCVVVDEYKLCVVKM